MRNDRNKKRVFSPIKTTKIPDEVYKQIVTLISSGEIKPSEKLPSERDISAELGVSRQSVREALYRAETMGFIEVKQGEGSFVRSSISNKLKAPLEVILGEQAERVFEFLEIRKLFEGWCAEKAAMVANSDDLKQIKDILDRMKELKTTDKQWEETDLKFHFAVVSAAHHVIAIHIMEALKVNFTTFFDFRQILEKIDKKELLWQHHYEIYDAIKQGKARIARQKLIDHLDFIEETIRESWKKSKFRIYDKH